MKNSPFSSPDPLSIRQVLVVKLKDPNSNPAISSSLRLIGAAIICTWEFIVATINLSTPRLHAGLSPQHLIIPIGKSIFIRREDCRLHEASKRCIRTFSLSTAQSLEIQIIKMPGMESSSGIFVFNLINYPHKKAQIQTSIQAFHRYQD